VGFSRGWALVRVGGSRSVKEISQTVMNSCSYAGRMTHVRVKPRKNVFKYGIFMLYLDLDELQELDRTRRLFSLNHFGVYSFYDSDHFKFIHETDPDRQLISQENVKYDANRYLKRTTKERVGLLLHDAGLDFSLGRVMVLTNPRIFGYVFNPVSFYFCFDDQGDFRALLSEVNNTFGDQKMYVFPIDDPHDEMFSTSQRKNFYISPYTDPDNVLSWRFRLPGERVMMLIDSIKGDEDELKASFVAERRPLTDRQILFLNFRYPLMTLMVIFRIHLQALVLYLKRIRFNDKKIIDQQYAGRIRRGK
jgi:DUF1365 family protein